MREFGADVDALDRSCGVYKDVEDGINAADTVRDGCGDEICWRRKQFERRDVCCETWAFPRALFMPHFSIALFPHGGEPMRT